MSRPLRVQFPGAWYHVMNRGMDKQLIFNNNEHRKSFLSLLEDMHKQYQIEIHAYCLMGNHYHLFLRTPLGNLGRAMRHLDGVYTQRYNRSMMRDGPIFRGRYKSILVDADNYMMQLSRYIHLNPVEANIVTSPHDYIWSSYNAYLNPHKKPFWLNTHVTLSHFSDCTKRYHQFVTAGNCKAFRGLIEQNPPPILGDKEFMTQATSRHIKLEHQIDEIPSHKIVRSPPSIDVIQNQVSLYYKISIDELKSTSTKNPNHLPCLVYIYLARKHGQCAYPKICKTLEMQ